MHAISHAISHPFWNRFLTDVGPIWGSKIRGTLIPHGAFSGVCFDACVQCVFDRFDDGFCVDVDLAKM